MTIIVQHNALIKDVC